MDIPQKKLFVKQKVETLEILTGFETKNKYRVMDDQQKDFLYAYEESNFLARQFLSRYRPLKIIIIDNNKAPQLTIERPFFWLRSSHTVKTADGQVLGYIRQKDWFLKLSFDVFDSSDKLLFNASSRKFRYWTYHVIKDGQEVGLVAKKWSGILKEGFTDADNFLIDFGTITDNKEKQLLLAAAFAIEVRAFESSSRRR